MLDKSFQEFFYRVDNWIDEGSGWIIESVDRGYVDISTLSPLSGSTYIEFPRRLRKSKTVTINNFFSVISDI